MRRAFSIIEIITVIGIILLLAMIVFPVIAGAKARAKEAPCMTNLRQLHVGWSLYLQANDDAWPDYMAKFEGKDKRLLLCPRDNAGGVNHLQLQSGGSPSSYFYVSNNESFRKSLLEADSNHGIIYCVLHGRHAGSASSWVDARAETTGVVLRVHIDGSVQRVNVPHYCSPATAQGFVQGRPEWYLLTSKACPQVYCLNADQPCSMTEGH